jgi:hypothetical protein
MAIFSNSLSSGHVTVEGMADVLIEFCADFADLLQHAGDMMASNSHHR